MQFVWVRGKEKEFEEALSVRIAVFVHEQGYSEGSEQDEQDANYLHVIGRQDGQAVCTARLYEEEGAWHIGRVAVLQQWRGKGIGLLLMQEVLRKGREKGAVCFVLNAQADKYHFYEQAGFSLTGNKMLDEGQPHVEMRMEV